MPLSQFLTCDELATRFSVGQRLIRRLVAEGSIPSIRIGRCVRISSDSLQQWLDSNQRVRAASTD